MRHAVLIVFLAVAAPSLAHGADMAVARRTHGHAAVTKSAYPWSWRARKIRSADNCWRGCEAGAGRTFQACLRAGNLSDCVQHNDAADRSCLWSCRLYGGPLVNWAE